MGATNGDTRNEHSNRRGLKISAMKRLRRAGATPAPGAAARFRPVRNPAGIHAGQALANRYYSYAPSLMRASRRLIASSWSLRGRTHIVS
jgi:hypothetical protein